MNKDSNYQQKLRLLYENILEKGKTQPNNIESLRNELQHLILMYGLPEETKEEIDNLKNEKGPSSLRSKIWKILLGVKRIDVNFYLNSVKTGVEKDVYNDIENDVFRTMPTDKEFTSRSPKSKITRVLNAFAVTYGGEKSDLSYVQGMNVVLAPFLYTLNEVDAFFCYRHFIVNLIPTYFKSTRPKSTKIEDLGMKGILAGCKLLEECLYYCDEDLYNHFKRLRIDFRAFYGYVQTMHANMEPMSELLHLWDFYFVFGFHLNSLVLISQLKLKRDEILTLNYGQIWTMLTKRELPKINARVLIDMTCRLLHKIPKELYNALCEHLTNQDLVEDILQNRITFIKPKK